MSESVSVFGLGRMGTAFAERLLDAGRSVTVWNRTSGKADGLLARGATEATSLEAAGASDVALSIVLDDAALASLHGPGGLLDGERRPGVWIDSSTVSPAAAEAATQAAAARGVAFVSAPVSGNPSVVRSGSAVFAVSSDNDDAVVIAQAVLSNIGRAVHVVGPGVSATMVKLCTNALLGITMQGIAEIAVLGEQAGVRRSGLMSFINDSAVGSPFTHYKTDAVVNLNLEPTFTPEGMRKDLRLAMDAGRKLNVPAPLISAVEVELSRLASSGIGEGKDFAALILQVARDAGLTLVPEVES